MAAEDIWHLSIDDLLATPVETPRLAGPGPFVINLSASTAPVYVPPNGVPGFTYLRVYQTSRMEDGRTRHRLRLGLFATEAEVEAALAVLREIYPSAFAAAAQEEDLQIGNQPAPHPTPHLTSTATPPSDPAPERIAASVPAPAAAARPAIPNDAVRKTAKRPKPPLPAKPAVAEQRLPDLAQEIEGILLAALSPVSRQATPESPAPAANATAVEAAPSLPLAQPVLEVSAPAAVENSAPAAAEEVITEEVPILKLPVEPAEPQVSTPATPAAVASTAADEPSIPDALGDFHALQLSLETETPAAEPVELISAAAEEALVATDAAIDPQLVLSILESPPVIKPPEVVEDAPPPDMDSTQTLRVLTPLELSDDSQSKWLVVELSNSEEPIDLAALPRLDIFAEYRLYSVNGLDQGRFLYSLRLGFFSEELSANVVASYLQSFFAGAAVKRISVAEHARFALRAAAANESIVVPQSGNATSIVLETKQPLRSTAARSSPAVPVSKQAPPAANSLWSRLFGDNSRTGS